LAAVRLDELKRTAFFGLPQENLRVYFDIVGVLSSKETRMTISYGGFDDVILGS
jgi:hypothetical protein